MRARIIDFLPDVYQSFLPEFFQSPLAEERHATCDNCAMCPPPEPEFAPEEYFSPSTKCCTFHPALPNYAVGGLLRDDTAAGAEAHRRIQQKIDRRIGVTPIGILPPAKRSLLQRHSPRAFGRASSLLCPYFDQERGSCTVWAHREAECATWFCKHNNGLDGREFWKQLRDYLVGVHRVLGVFALRELGFEANRIAKGFGPGADLDARDLDDQPPREDEYSEMWGTWVGREGELYKAAWDLVRALDQTRYNALTGLSGELQLALVVQRYEAMVRPRLPARLRRNPSMSAVRAPDGSYVLTSYDAGEPTRLRKPLYDLLENFDGQRTTADVRAAVLAETGLVISESFLRALYQHRILVDAGTT
jgi:hypothetical protein